MNGQPEIRKEILHVILETAAGLLLMWLAFFLLHHFFPDNVPFDYTVFLGGFCGGAVAVLNFFLMSRMVLRIASETDNKKAVNDMRASYTRRLLMQVAWMVIAMLAPCFQSVAGILPLLFPGIGIKLVGIFQKSNKTGGET